jgi:DNA polymerase-4
MDAFFVSVEEVLDPSLKGKAVIVGGNPNKRGVVAAASYEARKYGVRSAMPSAQAKRQCPHAIFLSGKHRRYAEFSRRIFEIFSKWSPRVEPMSLDEAYLDLSGCERLHGPTLDVAKKIRDAIKEQVGINASIGIGSNKLIAKIASEYAKPNGMLWITYGMEQKFLAPLAVSKIPGVGPKMAERLKRSGVKTAKQLADLPLEQLEMDYGNHGISLYHKARGWCGSPVAPQEETQSVGRETTLETDSSDPDFLHSILSYLSEKTAAELRQTELYARCITLKLRYSDFQTITRSQTLPMSTLEDAMIFKTAIRLLEASLNNKSRVRLIGIRLSSLVPSTPQQSDLFETHTPQSRDNLYRGIDRIRDKYGFRSILRGTSLRGEL